MKIRVQIFNKFQLIKLIKIDIMIKTGLRKHSIFAAIAVVILGFVSLAFTLVEQHPSDLNSNPIINQLSVNNTEVVPENSVGEIDIKNETSSTLSETTRTFLT